MNHRYNDRLRERLQEFARSMLSISQIYFEILNAERRRVKLLPRWRQFIYKNKSKSTVFMEALARMSDLDIAKITEDALGCRLPQFEDTNAHMLPVKPCILRETHELSSDEGRQNEPHNPLASTQTASLVTSRAESQENSQKISGTAVPPSPQRSERHSKSATGKKSEKSSFELQEVIIDGTAGVGTQQLVQLQPVVHHGSDDGRAAFSLNRNSFDTRNAVIPVKTIGALAPEQRGKSVARLLKAITRRPDGLAGVRSQQESSSTSIHVEYGQSAVETDCVVAKTSATHHLPRSRSGSRIRVSGTVDSISADHSASHFIFTAAARETEHASAASSSKDSPAPVTSATTAPCTAPRLPQRSRSQSQSTVPETAHPKQDTVQRNYSAETLDVALDAVAAQRKGSGSVASSVTLISLPQAPPRSRLKSRGRATEASRELATKDRLEDAASAADSYTEMSSRAPPQSAIASGLQEQARSKKISSKKTKNGGQKTPPISIVQRLRMAGAEFEEC